MKKWLVPIAGIALAVALCACSGAPTDAAGSLSDPQAESPVPASGTVDLQPAADATPRPTWPPTPEPVIQSGEPNIVLADDNGVTVTLTSYTFNKDDSLTYQLLIQNDTDKTVRCAAELATINHWIDYLGTPEGLQGFSSSDTDFVEPGAFKTFDCAIHLSRDHFYRTTFPLNSLESFSIETNAYDADSFDRVVSNSAIIPVADGASESPAAGAPIHETEHFQIFDMGYDPSQLSAYVLCAARADVPGYESFSIYPIVSGYTLYQSFYAESQKIELFKPWKIDLYPLLSAIGATAPASLELAMQPNREEPFVTCPIALPDDAKGALPEEGDVILENDILRMRHIGFSGNEYLVSIENRTDMICHYNIDTSAPMTVGSYADPELSSGSSVAVPGTKCVLSFMVNARYADAQVESRTLLDVDTVSFALRVSGYAESQNLDTTIPIDLLLIH